MRIILSVALLIVSLPALGATLAITSDKPTYDVGDTITLTIAGDAEGATSWGAYGNLLWDGSLADTLAVQQGSLGPDWSVYPALHGDGQAYVWNQIAYPEPLTGAGTTTISLLATSPGTLQFTWETELVQEQYWVPVVGPYTDGGYWACCTSRVAPTLEFFGAAARGDSVRIVGDVIVPDPPDPGPSVPEPSAALLFATSLIVCVLATRKRAPLARR